MAILPTKQVSREDKLTQVSHTARRTADEPSTYSANSYSKPTVQLTTVNVTRGRVGKMADEYN